MSAISISAPGYSGESLTSGCRRRLLSWYVPSLVCHLFAQFSINASTSDCATASLPDSAFNNFLKLKTNGSPCSLNCAIQSWHCFHHAWTSLIPGPRNFFSSYGSVRLRLAALSKSRASSSFLDFPVGALTYIRSASTPHRSLTSIHRCLACSLRRSLLKTCSEISSMRVPRVVKVGHRFFCDNIKFSQSSASWRPGSMIPTVNLSPRAPCHAAEHFCENTSHRIPSCSTE